jgi:hypothetical protein
VSLSAWVRIGWLVLAADIAYLLASGGEEQQLSRWRGILGWVLYLGGWVLFIVPLILSLLLWRVNERERTRS